MKNRRDFMKTSLVVAAGVFSANIPSAFAFKQLLTKGVVYTKDNPGKWMLHCHMLEHMAGGMATWFEII